mmetsp:Transcript_11741/g.43568  ORF Transcript_11741/g.43568 Transcript_11741/m.43568 type:complete len:224 (-) Transcript_11741:129-800(-)
MDSSPKSSLSLVSPRIMPSVANITGSVASFFMRSRSSFRKQVWSCDTSRTSHRGWPSNETRALFAFGELGGDAGDASSRISTPSSARLSPTFPTCSMSPMMCATSAVVPELFAPEPKELMICASVSTKATLYDCLVSSASHSLCGTFASRAPCECIFSSKRSSLRTPGKQADAIEAQCSPFGPCPSNTPMSISCGFVVVSSPTCANFASTRKQSWLTCAFLSG